ncbi:MAG TPA: CoA pyrophosphatase [Flavobacterium sp.]|nr:CoA pyrophosphatase [Flavobacterium sp.]
MEFNDFLKYIPKITKVALPGESAHFKMAPPERKDLLKKLDFSIINPRKAAVMMLVYPKNGLAHLALIQRNSYKGVHSSQIAFPGGKVEPDDASDLFTALRETEEEIGVPREHINIICPFSEVYIPPSNFCVQPFLGYCNDTPVFIPDSREVASMVEFSLSEFLDDNNIIMQKMATSYSESIDVPSFKVGGFAIWGATAMMLSELKEVLKAVL